MLSVLYWVLSALALLNEQPAPHLVKPVLDLVLLCRHEHGGFAPHPDHPPHLISTLSAVQILILLNRQDLLEEGAVADAADTRRYVWSMRMDDGGFRGSDMWESDSRFVYAALAALSLLPNGYSADLGDLEPTRRWLLKCQNLDGGFGCRPNGECESHAGHTFCSLASLSLLGGIDLGRRQMVRLVRWLGDRQCGKGGLNGRPGKAPDTCYTWWTMASLRLLSSVSYGPDTSPQSVFNLVGIQDFVKSCMVEGGGVAPHPGDDPDPFHTYFGLAGLALVTADEADGAFRSFSPVYALPSDMVPKCILASSCALITAPSA